MARQFLPAPRFVPARWDRRAAARVDEFIAISHKVQKRIAACYGREACLIYPPVDVTAFQIAPAVRDWRLFFDYFAADSLQTH